MKVVKSRVICGMKLPYEGNYWFCPDLDLYSDGEGGLLLEEDGFKCKRSGYK